MWARTEEEIRIKLTTRIYFRRRIIILDIIINLLYSTCQPLFKKESMKVQLNDIRKKSTWDGKEPPNHSVGFDYCRKLIKQGVDPKERLEIYRGDQLAYSMILEEGAKWTIREN